MQVWRFGFSLQHLTLHGSKSRRHTKPDIAPVFVCHDSWLYIVNGDEHKQCTVGNFCSQTVMRAKMKLALYQDLTIYMYQNYTF